MLWLTRSFALELPPGFTPTAPGADVCLEIVEDAAFRASDPARGLEITVAATPSAEPVPLELAATALIVARQRSLEAADPSATFTPVLADARPRHAIQHFACAGAGGSFVFVAVAARSFGAAHALVTLELRRGVVVAAAPPTHADIAAIAAAVLDSLTLFDPVARAPARVGGEAAAPRSLVPYPNFASIEPEKGLSPAFVEDADAVDDAPTFVADVTEEEAAGAVAHLEAAVAAGRVGIACIAGPRGLPVVVFGPERLAPSCVFLPDLRAFAARFLGPPPFVAALTRAWDFADGAAPRSSALLIFRAEDAAYRREARAFAAAGGGPAHLVALEPDGLWPIASDGGEGN